MKPPVCIDFMQEFINPVIVRSFHGLVEKKLISLEDLEK